MIGHLAAFLHGLPLLCLFLSILLGTFIGRFHFKGVGFGVGGRHADRRHRRSASSAKPELPDLLRWAFFYLFLFSIGYSVGPAVFRQPEEGGAAADRAGAHRRGQRPGDGDRRHAPRSASTRDWPSALLSGGMTQSAALGTGLSAIAELPISDAEKATLLADAPLADAITYGFGDLGLILFLTWLGPKILRADLKREAKELEATLSGGKPAARSLHGAHFESSRVRVETLPWRAQPLARSKSGYAAERAVGAARAARRRTAEAGSGAGAAVAATGSWSPRVAAAFCRRGTRHRTGRSTTRRCSRCR